MSSIRHEPDHAGQAKAVANQTAKILRSAADLQIMAAGLLELTANPRQVCILEPSPAQTEAYKEVMENLKESNRRWTDVNTLTPADVNSAGFGVSNPPKFTEIEVTPPSPGPRPFAPDTTPGYQVEAVLRANNIAYSLLNESDYVLTDHVVTPDVDQLFAEAFGGKPYSVTGAVTGPFADLRRRPDLFKPKFDGSTPHGTTTAGRKADRIPNSDGEQ